MFLMIEIHIVQIIFYKSKLYLSTGFRVLGLGLGFWF